jgi:hypothetical protein
MRVRVPVITFRLAGAVFIWNYRISILYFLCNQVQYYIPFFPQPGIRVTDIATVLSKRSGIHHYNLVVTIVFI